MKAIKHCALYTRKSTEEGLDQAFNSLDAQREACLAYVKSQKGEGWRRIATRYDDGGFSGGSMERPALKRLLSDISAGKVDVVVVYKIDRLTRSLTDFARMVELFDRHDVSFISVTQSFNTTSSMGRLTLNVLLSFAQFEREVTGERIRDKIAASKKKGLWMGGNVPLGYDLPLDGSRQLAENNAEAEIVRSIFRAYLELGSVNALQLWLAEKGIRSKRRTTRQGRIIGGRPFSRGALFHLLRNRTYLGEIVHKDNAYPGLHAAIVDSALFGAVQAQLNDKTRDQTAHRERVQQAPLVGCIFDEHGHPMTPSFTRGKRGRVYRYYVRAPLRQSHVPDDKVSIRRVPAPAIEDLLRATIRSLVPTDSSDPLSVISRVEVHPDTLQLAMPIKLLSAVRPRLGPTETAEKDASDPDLFRLTLPIRMQLRGGRTWVIGATNTQTRRDPVLIKALRRAHAMLEVDKTGLPILDSAPSSPHRRQLIRLAFLAPELQKQIFAGQQPPGLTLERLLYTPIPSLWSEQATLLNTLGVQRRIGTSHPVGH